VLHVRAHRGHVVSQKINSKSPGFGIYVESRAGIDREFCNGSFKSFNYALKPGQLSPNTGGGPLVLSNVLVQPCSPLQIWQGRLQLYAQKVTQIFKLDCGELMGQFGLCLERHEIVLLLDRREGSRNGTIVTHT
jgi:hypothetical protein